MAYDRYEGRGGPRDEASRWPEGRESESHWGRDRGDWRGTRGSPEDRGFFERAGDEIASWFGDDDAERRRREDHGRDDRGYGARPSGDSRDRGWGYRDRDLNRDRNWNDNRGTFASGGSSEGDYNRGWQRDLGGRGAERFRERFRDGGRDYRPMTGDYGRIDRRDDEWSRDPYRSTSRAGTSDRSDRSRHEDPRYRSWRDRQMSELDRDYEDYRREHQSKFESDFGSWRERRQQKRSMLGQVREHMEVVGNDSEHVGTIDKVAGDRLILTKSDEDGGGAHHSLSCSDVDRIEGDRLILDCSAKQAQERWRDESRSRALFEREDQGEMGPRMLDHSFEGTYR